MSKSKKEQDELKAELAEMVESLQEGELSPEERKTTIASHLESLRQLGFPIDLGKAKAKEPVLATEEEEEEGEQPDLSNLVQPRNTTMDRAHYAMKIRYDPELRLQHSRVAPAMILAVCANYTIAQYIKLRSDVKNKKKPIWLRDLFINNLLDTTNSYRGWGIEGLQKLAGVVNRQEDAGFGDWAKG